MLRGGLVLNVILGYQLDSGAYPHTLSLEDAVVGKVVTGFKGLLGILETHLGLVGPAISEVRRIAQWEESIRQFGSDAPWYRSFEVDSWNTTKEVLRLRDELVLAGWDSSMRDGGLWITALADLESINGDAPLGFSDRVRTVLSRLTEGVKLPISVITVVDESDNLWEPWCNQLLASLAKQSIRIERQSSISDTADANSDLGRFQRFIEGQTAYSPAQGDGSLLLIRARQEWDAADYMISWLQRHGSSETVIIGGSNSLLVDGLMHRRGLPALGADHPSRWRSILQVLPLTLETYWKPVKIEAWLQLLTLPDSPVPSRIRYRLARAISEAPGIAGPAWKQAIDDGLQSYEELWSQDTPSSEDLRSLRRRLQDRIEVWIEHGTFEPEPGMPLQKVLRICGSIAQWASLCYEQTDEEIYLSAASHASMVADAVRVLDIGTLPRLQLKRILESVIGEGISLGAMGPEASPWTVVDTPEQIWGVADFVVWWGFRRSTVGRTARQWTIVERDWLQGQGVHLPDESIEQRREAHMWKRAARMARKRLILLAPEQVQGKTATIHPLWDEIRHAVARDQDSENLLVVHADSLRADSFVTLSADSFEREMLDSIPVPSSRRIWTAPIDMLAPRDLESATSLETLLGCPLNWTLAYHGRVRSGRILSLPEESQMLGRLAHETLRYQLSHSEGIEVTEGHISTWFDELVGQLAAPLLEPQNGVLRQQAKDMLTKSLLHFQDLMSEVGLRIERTEHTLRKLWKPGVEVEGRLDIIGVTASGTPMLIDAKWSKHPGNYESRLRNLSTQLTVYHWLMTEDLSAELPVSYFMLRGGQFYSKPHIDIPKRYHVEGPPFSESMALLRGALEARWESLRAGTVVAAGIPGEPVFSPDTEEHADDQDEDLDFNIAPVVAPPCKYCQFLHLCGFSGVRR